MKPIGRPSITGLSVKLLGVNEYQKLYARFHKPHKTSRRWHTGLSRKQLGGALYAKLLRRKAKLRWAAMVLTAGNAGAEGKEK